MVSGAQEEGGRRLDHSGFRGRSGAAARRVLGVGRLHGGCPDANKVFLVLLSVCGDFRHLDRVANVWCMTLDGVTSRDSIVRTFAGVLMDVVGVALYLLQLAEESAC